MPFETWGDTRTALVSALEELPDGAFLILGEPTCDTGTRRNGFGRRPRPVPTRYVQTLRIIDFFSAECVGATSLGGTWQMDTLTIAQLRSMGWKTPAETKRAYGNVTPNFGLYVEQAGTPDLADFLIVTLRLLGTQPTALDLHTGV